MCRNFFKILVVSAQYFALFSRKGGKGLGKSQTNDVKSSKSNFESSDSSTDDWHVSFLSAILNNYFLRSHLELEWSISQLVWTFCFSLILVVSILGNSIVLWIILGTSRNIQHSWVQALLSLRLCVDISRLSSR